MIWVLIIIMYGGPGGVAATSVQYDSEVACEVAAHRVREIKRPYYIEIKTECTPTGTVKRGNYGR